MHRREERGASLDDAIQAAKHWFDALHPGVAAFASNGLEQYFEFHESREEVTGELRFIGNWTTIPHSEEDTLQLAAWGPLYESGTGIREIRRLRYGRARDGASSWSDIAARVAADATGHQEVNGVNVVEVGLLDGSSYVIIADETPQTAKERFDQRGKAAANKAVTGTTVRPGPTCARCKIVSSCTALIKLDSAMQQSGPGPHTRSVSANDLARYEDCPARWHLESENLPVEPEHGEAKLRGLAVQSWLRIAHNRMLKCTSADIPSPDADHLGLAEGFIDRDAYRLAFPYLQQHIAACPLPNRISDVISVGRDAHGYDSVTDVVLIARPNMMLLDDGKLILHETKTSQRPLPADADEARGQHLAVAFDLVILDAGLIAHYSADLGQVNLEVLTPTGAKTFKYRTDDSALMAMAKARIRNLGRTWSNDTDWRTAPSPQCGWCPVRRWCPDGKTHDDIDR
ncbi:PD-(D/E)XK nuclease family protein [Saccharothrix saharensis]|uniref:PD-(D/E)XK nuclease family protein n=1 Tax=Saccharothrix saharensis TaxID=571190 RepID=UPI001478FEA6|nr:PD-(D/E)XK nuclease family protein [Saccharothrix saharensis]